MSHGHGHGGQDGANSAAGAHRWRLRLAFVMVAVFFVVREVRAGRRGPGEVDRLSSEAHREAAVNRDRFGPNGGAETWLG